MLTDGQDRTGGLTGSPDTAAREKEEAQEEVEATAKAGTGFDPSAVTSPPEGSANLHRVPCNQPLRRMPDHRSVPTTPGEGRQSRPF